MRKPLPTTVFAAVALALCAQASLAQTSAGRATGTAAASTTPARTVQGSSSGGVANTSPSASPQGSGSNLVSSVSLSNSGQSNQSGSTVYALVGTRGGIATFDVPVAPAGTSNGVGPSQGMADANGQLMTMDGRGIIGIAPMGYGADSGIVTGTPDAGGQQVVFVNAANAAADAPTPTPELDRLTRKEVEKARVASRSRNKQLLYSITPRNTVDRTGQMADDPIGPRY